jgi:hypothetical protein
MGKTWRRTQKNGRERGRGKGNGMGHWGEWNGGNLGKTKSRQDVVENENRRLKQERNWDND